MPFLVGKTDMRRFRYKKQIKGKKSDRGGQKCDRIGSSTIFSDLNSTFFRIQQSSFAVPLMEVLLDIVEEKVSLQTQNYF